MIGLCAAVLALFLAPVTHSPADPCAAVAAQLSATRDYTAGMRQCLGNEDSPAVAFILS